MIQSLFAARATRPVDAAETRWAATDSLPLAANAGSPADAIRARLHSNRGDLSRAGAMVTLLDLAGTWPRAVAHGLAPACGEQANTVDLRNLVGLLPGTRIERVSVGLPGAPRVKVYAVESRHAGQRESIALALAERSHLALALVGPLTGEALQAMLNTLEVAARRHGWACPRLVFALAPGAAGQRAAILAQDWPGTLAVEVLDLPAGPAGPALWQVLQRAWAPALPAEAPPPPAAVPVLHSAAPLAPDAWPASLEAVAGLPGVRGITLVDIEFGHAVGLAGEGVGEMETPASALAAAIGLLNWRLGADARSEELLVTRSDGLYLLRPSRIRQRLGFVLKLAPDADLSLLRQALQALDREAVLAAAGA